MSNERVKIRRYNYHERKENAFYEIADQVFNYGSPWTEKQYKETLAREDLVFFVAEVNNRVIGYIGGRILFDEADIYTVAVSKDSQNQRIGRYLLEHFKEICKKQGVKVIFLEVRKSNLAAQTFYRENLFKGFTMRKNYYSQPVEDAVIMRYRI
ncbi:ribosomal protein S18-alanine N-acetyltransferase [Alkalibacterium kapii]|uniref:[Ribosomal protein bS18]-alanine N-acetyltransferase n=1 Tax=Alkalibacterium kapii TaxID=426704 RepID=A0A511AQT1_9LACT|nr:ribosomal protein S18-alanine N-acetyltransferase [Alkalibacterium kapii]GEK90549.1 ribosomal-protein-alanine acetyltransferase [Alkalibacterium kapii]